MRTLKYAVIAGDVLYILWILYNAMDDGFHDILSVQAVVLIGLIVLLVLNIALLRERS